MQELVLVFAPMQSSPGCPKAPVNKAMLHPSPSLPASLLVPPVIDHCLSRNVGCTFSFLMPSPNEIFTFLETFTGFFGKAFPSYRSLWGSPNNALSRLADGEHCPTKTPDNLCGVRSLPSYYQWGILVTGQHPLFSHHHKLWWHTLEPDLHDTQKPGCFSNTRLLSCKPLKLWEC